MDANTLLDAAADMLESAIDTINLAQVESASERKRMNLENIMNRLNSVYTTVLIEMMED